VQKSEFEGSNLGALVATKDKNLFSDNTVEAGELHAYKSPRPNEYMDALGRVLSTCGLRLKPVGFRDGEIRLVQRLSLSR